MLSPLEKVVFLKNMCLADTFVSGKKWQIALFQVDSRFESEKHQVSAVLLGSQGLQTAGF